jgi:hypothetical protein
MNTDNKGNVTAELPEDAYEAHVEQFGLNNVCDLAQNAVILFVEPKNIGGKYKQPLNTFFSCHRKKGAHSSRLFCCTSWNSAVHPSEQHCTLRLLVVCLSGANNESETLVFKPLRDFLHVGQTRFPSLSNCSLSTIFLTGISITAIALTTIGLLLVFSNLDIKITQ